MMKKTFLSILLLIVCNSIVISQQTSFSDSMRYYRKNGNLEKAIYWGQLNADSIKERVGEFDTLYALSINNLGLFYFENANYTKAVSLFKEAASIYKEQLGSYNGHYLFTLKNLGDAFQKTANYTEAEAYLLESINGKRKLADTLNSDFANSLGSLGLVYTLTGKYESAKPLYLLSMSMFERMGKDTIIDYAKVVNSLASLFYRMGRYKQAEVTMQRALALHKSIVGEKNWEYAIVANNLASIYFQLGNLSTAIGIWEDLRPNVISQLGEKHPFFATITGHLAMSYYQLGQYAKAEPYMLLQLQINENTMGRKSNEYTVVTNNIGNLYLRKGDHEKAGFYFNETESIRKELFGVNNNMYAMALNNLALLNTSINDYVIADSLYTLALKILAETVGEIHPDYLVVQNNYCEYLQKSKQYEKASILAFNLLEKEKKLLREKLDYLTTAELQAYLINKIPAYMQPAAALSFHYSPELARAVFDFQLFIKGIAVANFVSLSKRMEIINDTAITTLWKKYKYNNVQLNRMLVQPATKRTMNADSLSRIANQQEKQLLDLSSTYREIKDKLTLTGNEVRQSLLDDEAAVDYIRFRILNQQNDYEFHYAAMISRSRDSMPMFVNLCNEDELMASLKKFAYKDNAGFYKYEKASNTGKTVYQLIFKPLEKYIAGIKKVYFSPDGLLHQLAFASIPVSGSLLLIDKYKLVQVTSLRQLATGADHYKPPAVAALFGGINYNSQTTEADTKADPDAFAYVYQQKHRGFVDSFYYLPNSLPEVDSIIFKLQAVQTKIYKYTGVNASENNFRIFTSAYKPSVLHFATHGFALPDTTMYLKKSNAYTISKNPLLRTGLVMAGGNKGWNGTNSINEDDGILTGSEVANMQLQGVQLVVLSACETAAGEVKGSEGVFGLQRAFKMAGADYVMATLWQVPDKETKEFMNLFYKNWLTGSTIQAAFTTTQQAMRKKRPPYYWAGFILVK